MWSGFGTQAFNVSRRVAASSVGETKKTSPSNFSSGNGFTVILTGMPVRTNGTPISGSANTSCSRSTASIRTSFVMRRTRSPGDTWRAPTTPSNGARTLVFSSSTSRSCTSERTTSSSALALSYSACAVTSRAWSAVMRRKISSASFARARASRTRACACWRS